MSRPLSRRTTLQKHLRDFEISGVRKPPPKAVAKTLVAEQMAADISRRNGPNTVKQLVNLEHQIKIPRYVLCSQLLSMSCRLLLIFPDPRTDHGFGSSCASWTLKARVSGPLRHAEKFVAHGSRLQESLQRSMPTATRNSRAWLLAWVLWGFPYTRSARSGRDCC